MTNVKVQQLTTKKEKDVKEGGDERVRKERNAKADVIVRSTRSSFFA